MNKLDRVCMIVTAIIGATMLAVPPWIEVDGRGHIAGRAYALLFMPPEGFRGARIDTIALLCEFGMLAFIFFVVWIMIWKREEA